MDDHLLWSDPEAANVKFAGKFQCPRFRVNGKQETRNSRDAEDEIASTFSGINNFLNR